MAGNQNTPRSVAITAAQKKAMGRVGGGNAKVSAQTTPGSKGVKVGVNNKATLPGNKTMSTAPGMKKKKK